MSLQFKQPVVVLYFNQGCDVTSSGSELLEDVRHFIRGPRLERAPVRLPELVGDHDALHRRHRARARRQQGSHPAATHRLCSSECATNIHLVLVITCFRLETIDYWIDVVCVKTCDYFSHCFLY